MNYNRYTVSVCFQLAGIMGTAFAMGYILPGRQEFYLFIFLVFILAGLIASLLNTVHRVFRDMAFFFEAIHNEDGSLRFPARTGSKSMDFLHLKMNELAMEIEEIRRQSVIRENYFQALLQHSATGLIAMNEDNEISIINQKASEYAGIPAESVPGILKFRNSELSQYLIRIQAGETVTFHTRRNEIPLHLSLWATKIKIGNEHYKLISLQDIQHELNAKELESWQKLIRVLTHEIMNSIAPITSLTASLKHYFKRGADPVSSQQITEKMIANTVQGLDTIEERGTGLLRFVESYRRLYQIPKPDRKPFQVDDWLARHKILLTEKLNEQGIQLEISSSGNKMIQADENLLSHALINILTNAMEALMEVKENRKIRIHSEDDSKGRTLITVSNNGPAIPKDILDRIFVPFYTTKENGSGIGLSLCRQIIHLHGGSLEVMSDTSITSFIIIL
jgi:two-component system, NtrC family, nitrogen regulation sensor histidine kinase NtrY